MRRFFHNLRLEMAALFRPLMPGNVKKSLAEGQKQPLYRAIMLVVLTLVAIAYATFGERLFLSFIMRIADNTRVKMAMFFVPTNGLTLPELLVVFLLCAISIVCLVYSITQWIGFFLEQSRNPRDTGRPMFAARMVRLYLIELLLVTVIMQPLVIQFTAMTRRDSSFYFRALLINLCLPLIPMGLSGLLMHILTLVSAFRLHRNAVLLIGSVLLMILECLVCYWLTASVCKSLDAENVLDLATAIVAGNLNLLTMITAAFPPMRWAALGLMEGTADLWMFVGISIGAFLLPLILYPTRAEKAGRLTEPRPADPMMDATLPLGSIIRAEIRRLSHRPVVVAHAVQELILLPSFLFMTLIMTLASFRGGEIRLGVNLVNLMSLPDYGLAGVFTMLFMIGGLMNILGCGAVSRDLPQISTKRIVQAKYWIAFITSALGVFIACILQFIFFSSEILSLFLTLAWSLMLHLLFVSVAVSVDLIHPKHRWDRDNEVIRESSNALLSFLINVAVVGPLIYGVRQMIKYDLSSALCIPVITAFIVCLTLASLLLYRRMLRTKAPDAPEAPCNPA